MVGADTKKQQSSANRDPANTKEADGGNIEIHWKRSKEIQRGDVLDDYVMLEMISRQCSPTKQRGRQDNE